MLIFHLTLTERDARQTVYNDDENFPRERAYIYMYFYMLATWKSDQFIQGKNNILSAAIIRPINYWIDDLLYNCRD